MNRLLLILFFCFALFETSCGQKKKSKPEESTVTTTDVDTSRSAFQDTSFSIKPLGWTNDFEYIFSNEQIVELDSIITKFEKETTNEIAIVTIKSYWTTKEDFDNFTLEIARKWGVGKKVKNNGVLIGISAGLKKIRIQNGYGIEKILTNQETKNIVDDTIVPEFKKGNYFEGTKKGLLAIMQKIR